MKSKILWYEKTIIYRLSRYICLWDKIHSTLVWNTALDEASLRAKLCRSIQDFRKEFEIFLFKIGIYLFKMCELKF